MKLKDLKKKQIIRLVIYFVFIAVYTSNSCLFIKALAGARFYTPEATPLFEDQKGLYLSDYVNKDGTYGYWEINGDIPDRIKKAFISIEDKRFYRHAGVDFRSIARAFFNNITGKRVQGASTIAMQTARLQGHGIRNTSNKIQEALSAVLMTVFYGQEKVLRQYLRIVPQGNQMCGVAYSARRYFKKPLEDLTWMEAAALAAIVKAPGAMNLFSAEGLVKVRKRANIILAELYKQGMIDKESFRISLDQLSSLGFQYKETRPPEAYHYILRLITEYEKDKEKNFNRPIRTNLDLGVQKELQKIALVGMAKYRPMGAGNTALMVLEKKTGAVIGYIGSADYFDDKFKGSINYAATMRSSGSTLKPFIYALGLQANIFSPASIVADLPLDIISKTTEYSAINFDNEYLGPMLYRRALANSRNTPAIRVLQAIGLETSLRFLNTLGIGLSGHSYEYYGYGMAIGTIYATLEQTVKAYAILANEGRDTALWWYGDKPGSKEALISKNAARQITLFLSDDLARLPSFPQFNEMYFPFPVAVKTGTSQGFRDGWCLAYSSRYVVGAWIGHYNNDSMNHVAGSITADLVNRCFAFLQPEQNRGFKEVPFPLPERTSPYKICIFSGKLAVHECSNTIIEYFEEGTQPHDLCDYHKKIAIDKTTGLSADSRTLDSNVIIKSFTVFPPQYSAWAVKNGYTLPSLSTKQIPDTSITITSPGSGSHLVLDPTVPMKFQSIALRASVTPSVPEIIWIIDDKEYKHTAYPYETRWNLLPGLHSIQAKFSRAQVYSEKIFIKIDNYY